MRSRPTDIGLTIAGQERLCSAAELLNTSMFLAQHLHLL
jgi:hypothetical protein